MENQNEKLLPHQISQEFNNLSFLQKMSFISHNNVCFVDSELVVIKSNYNFKVEDAIDKYNNYLLSTDVSVMGTHFNPNSYKEFKNFQEEVNKSIKIEIVNPDFKLNLDNERSLIIQGNDVFFLNSKHAFVRTFNDCENVILRNDFVFFNQNSINLVDEHKLNLVKIDFRNDKIEVFKDVLELPIKSDDIILSDLKGEKKYSDIINTPIKEYPKIGYNLLIKNYPFIEKDGKKIQLDTSIKNINNYNLEIFKDGSQKIIAIINKEGTVNELICNVDDFKINSIDKKIDFKTSKDGITNIKSFDLNMGVFNKITNNKNRNLFNKDIDI